MHKSRVQRLYVSARRANYRYGPHHHRQPRQSGGPRREAQCLTTTIAMTMGVYYGIGERLQERRWLRGALAAGMAVLAAGFIAQREGGEESQSP